MKYFFGKVFGLAALFFFLLFFGSNGVCAAESQALQQLLDLLRQNGAISDEQAGIIKATLAKDQKALSDREKELEQREKALVQREQALKEKVKAQTPTQKVIAHGGKKPSTLSLPQEKT